MKSNIARLAPLLPVLNCAEPNLPPANMEMSHANLDVCVQGEGPYEISLLKTEDGVEYRVLFHEATEQVLSDTVNLSSTKAIVDYAMELGEDSSRTDTYVDRKEDIDDDCRYYQSLSSRSGYMGENPNREYTEGVYCAKSNENYLFGAAVPTNNPLPYEFMRSNECHETLDLPDTQCFDSNSYAHPRSGREVAYWEDDNTANQWAFSL